MNALLRISSYLFHPIWMPFAGAFLFFLVTPRFFPLEAVKAKLIAIAIMTLFIPMVFFFMLRTLDKASSFFLEKVEERKWPLLFSAAVNLIILKYVVDKFDYPELFYFFLGILVSTLLAVLFVLIKVRISLHMMGLAGVTAFLIVLSFYFQLNLVYTISFFITVTGLTASSRMYFDAHTYAELLLGLSVGFIPQILVFFTWLQ